jgi:hypothetical protein
MSNETRNPLGYLGSWQPYRKAQIMLGQVKCILDENAAHLPLTCRQIYYRMIGEFRYTKGEKFKRSLYDLLVNARRAEEIPFEHIRDDGIMNCGGVWYDDALGAWRSIDATLDAYQRNRQQGQEQRVEVWCESAGMIPQLRRAAYPFSIPVYSCGGFNSLTAIRQIVDDCAVFGKDTVVLHLGDYDPSGLSIFERVCDDVSAFLEEDAPSVGFEGRRVALIGDYLDYAGTKPTPDGLKQIVEYDLPMDPLTTNDERSKAWIRQGRTEKCEMEALLPSVVADALTVAIEELIDTDVLKKVKAKEESDRSGLWYARGVPDFRNPT